MSSLELLETFFFFFFLTFWALIEECVIIVCSIPENRYIQHLAPAPIGQLHFPYQSTYIPYIFPPPPFKLNMFHTPHFALPPIGQLHVPYQKIYTLHLSPSPIKIVSSIPEYNIPYILLAPASIGQLFVLYQNTGIPNNLPPHPLARGVLLLNKTDSLSYDVV